MKKRQTMPTPPETSLDPTELETERSRTRWIEEHGTQPDAQNLSDLQLGDWLERQQKRRRSAPTNGRRS